jgi:protein MpaA
MVGVLLGQMGCQPAAHAPGLQTDFGEDSPLPAGQYHIVGRSVRGRPIVAQIFGTGSDVTLIVGTIHGDETAGTPLVRRLARHLENNRSLLRGRTVVLVATVNPDGKIDGTRHNARGVDLNRNFPAANRENNRENGPAGLSEPESVAIYQLIRRYQPDRIVALHQPLACIDYDGPAQDLAQSMAAHCQLPVKKIGARPGSLGSYAGETQKIPIITMEMLKGDTLLSDTQLWVRYGDVLLAAINSPIQAPDVWHAR